MFKFFIFRRVKEKYKFKRKGVLYMEENKNIKNDVNSMSDVSAENVERKGNSKGVTVVMIVIILLLVLAIGTCIGFLFTGDTLKIINNTEQIENKNAEIDKNNKVEENVQIEDNKTENEKIEDDKAENNKIENDKAENDKVDNNEKENVSEKLTKINITDDAMIKIVAEMKDFADGTKLSPEEYASCVYYAINERYIDVEEKLEYTEKEVNNIVYSIFGTELKEYKSCGTSFRYENGKYKMEWSDRGVSSLDIRNVEIDVAAGTKYITYDFYIVGPSEYIKNGEEYQGTYEIARTSDGFIKYKKRVDDNKVQKQESVAVTEIKKCLKDKKWLEENVMVTDSNGKVAEQKLSFIKLKSDTDSPLIIIEAFSEKYLHSKVTMVTYLNGKIVLDTLLDHGQTSVWVDANNRIVKFYRGEYQGEIFYNYMTISGGKVVNSEFVINSLKDNKYYYGNLESEQQEGTKETFDNLVAQYEKYNFVEIGTELNYSNIDAFIK